LHGSGSRAIGMGIAALDVPRMMTENILSFAKRFAGHGNLVKLGLATIIVFIWKYKLTFW